MIEKPWRAAAPTQRHAVPLGLVVLLGLGLAAAVRPAAAQDFPNIPAWSFVGAWKPGAGADTIDTRPRTLTLRWLRDPVAEARTEFGGYRIFRATTFGDTTTMVLLRRFSKQDQDRAGLDSPYYLWHFPPIDPGNPDLNLRVATFIDPDSTGRFIKVCRLRSPQSGPDGVCISRGDSVFLLVSPPGPHDGFRTWYGVTYEMRNISSNDFAEEFVPDTLDDFARCRGFTDPDSCPNLNHKAANISNDVWEPRAASADPDSQFFARAVEPTRGPTANLEQAGVVPNPYRASETWNPAGGHELHFINLPNRATIRIYTVSGDLVRELQHADAIRDYEAWDLKNENGRDVVSGIYLYRVEADGFNFQSRFVVIR